MSEMQAHHCMTSEQRSYLLCNISILLANKLSLQELNQLIEIICCLQVLQELVAARLNFQGENAHSPPPLRTPMCAGLLFSNFTSLDDIARNGT